MLQMSQKTHWSHILISFNQVKLFKLIFINRFNDLFLLFSEMRVLWNQNKAREEPVSWILKSFNLIEWNQIVGPVCFLTFGRRSAYKFWKNNSPWGALFLPGTYILTKKINVKVYVQGFLMFDQFLLYK